MLPFGSTMCPQSRVLLVSALEIGTGLSVLVEYTMQTSVNEHFSESHGCAEHENQYQQLKCWDSCPVWAENLK